MQNTLFWSVPYMTIRNKFQSLFEDVVLGSLKYFNWTIKSILGSISWRLLHSTTLEINQLSRFDIMLMCF